MINYHVILKVKIGWSNIIDLEEFESIGTHKMSLYVNGNKKIYFGSFGVEHIPKGIIKFIGNKNVITNIYRIQPFDSIMCRCFHIGFTDFMLKSKIYYANYTNLLYKLTQIYNYMVIQLYKIIQDYTIIQD